MFWNITYSTSYKVFKISNNNTITTKNYSPRCTKERPLELTLTHQFQLMAAQLLAKRWPPQYAWQSISDAQGSVFLLRGGAGAKSPGQQSNSSGRGGVVLKIFPGAGATPCYKQFLYCVTGRGVHPCPTYPEIPEKKKVPRNTRSNVSILDIEKPLLTRWALNGKCKS